MYSLLQWNILYKEPIQNIASFIRSVDPDIACLQEVSRGVEEQKFIDTVEYLKNSLPEYSINYTEGQKWPEENGHLFEVGNAILSKFQVIQKMHTYVQDAHEDPKEDYTKQGRVYIEVEVNVGGTLFTIGTVHMSFAPQFEMTNSRIREADRLLDVVRSKDSRYILTGDFNATPDSYTVEGILKHLKNAGPDFLEKSWTTKPFDYPGFFVNTLAYRLDYVFCSKDVEIVKSDVLKTSFSDHLPILIKFLPRIEP